MLNFLKKLFLSNKYSLLILLILSLWLKLMKDYNIILSYLVLIAMYLVIGIFVEMVLEKFFPNFSQPQRGERTSAVHHYKDSNEEEHQKNSAEDLLEHSNPERRYTARSTTVKREFLHDNETKMQGSTLGQTGIQNRARKLEKSGDTPKVTSSYIKNAGSIPRDMEKKLIRTAANFNSIKRDSELLFSGEEITRRGSGNVKNPFADTKDDLYTNKKHTASSDSLDILPKEETDRKEPEERKAPEEQVVEPEAIRPSIRDTRYDPSEDYKTSTSDEHEKISEDISREVERRITAPRTARRTRIILPEDSSDIVSEPRPPRKQELYSSVRRDSSFRTEPAENARPAENVSAEDKVSADMEKIDRLFNRNRDTSEETREQNKTGVWNRFKKKR